MPRGGRNRARYPRVPLEGKRRTALNIRRTGIALISPVGRHAAENACVDTPLWRNPLSAFFRHGRRRAAGSASAGTAPRPRRLFPAADSAFRAEPSGAPAVVPADCRTAARVRLHLLRSVDTAEPRRIVRRVEASNRGRQIFSRAKRSSRADCPLGGPERSI